ncbi:DUF1707 SHOCT-like domain-containing protein [Saccharothrix isguenensis]
MSERDIRIGDAEREHALELLGTHLGEGRLTVDEFGERSARVATAKTRGDLYTLFGDLPAPRPSFTRVEPEVRPVGSVQRDPRLNGAVVMAVAFVSFALLFVVKTPLILLLIPAAMLLVSRWGGR